VPDDELTARFLFDPKHFNSTAKRVKPKAYQPARRDNRTSVFLIAGLEIAAIWQLALDHVVPVRSKPVLARADLPASNIINVGLTISPDEPPPRHANICAWPTAKDEWKSLAQELAAAAELNLP